MGSARLDSIVSEQDTKTTRFPEVTRTGHVNRQAHATAIALERTESREWYEQYEDRRRLTGEAYYRVKRVLDIILCLLGMPVVLLVLGLVCIAIKIDSPGPCFFYQRRTGKGGRRFKMFKMRTMVKNAEELKEKYMHLNELTYPDFKITMDPRITRIGGFLRKTSLDEVPQIFNVIKGDMSLVGPRPTSFSAKTYRMWHTARLEAIPGMTGLWQVCGRNELDFDERLRLDIAYMKNQCIVLDMQIILRTVGSVFHGRGAN